MNPHGGIFPAQPTPHATTLRLVRPEEEKETSLSALTRQATAGPTEIQTQSGEPKLTTESDGRRVLLNKHALTNLASPLAGLRRWNFHPRIRLADRETRQAALPGRRIWVGQQMLQSLPRYTRA
jgi:hypothetical protein